MGQTSKAWQKIGTCEFLGDAGWPMILRDYHVGEWSWQARLVPQEVWSWVFGSKRRGKQNIRIVTLADFVCEKDGNTRNIHQRLVDYELVDILITPRPPISICCSWCFAPSQSPGYTWPYLVLVALVDRHSLWPLKRLTQKGHKERSDNIAFQLDMINRLRHQFEMVKGCKRI